MPDWRNFFHDGVGELRSQIASIEKMAQRFITSAYNRMLHHGHYKLNWEIRSAVLQAKVCDLIKNIPESEEEIALTEKSDETQLLARKPRNDSPSAIAVLFGDDYNVENSDRAKLNQYCQDMCPPIQIEPMSWWKTNDHKYPRLAKLAKVYFRAIREGVLCGRANCEPLAFPSSS